MAIELFAVNGPDVVTLEQIAHASGISRRTFFRYYASRDDILAAFPRRLIGRLAQHVRDRPPTESVIAAFAAAERLIENIPEDEDYLTLWRKVIESSPDVAARVFGLAGA